MEILVTGGAGYIGSHTIIELQNAGYNVYSIDNYITSTPETYNRIKSITGKDITYYECDLTDLEALKIIFEKHKFDAVIHFAALKLVGESVLNPILYFKNNINSLINILHCMNEFSCNAIIFSSSCSVYGNTLTIPVKETEVFGRAESPYAASKQASEILLQSYLKSINSAKCVSLRYFNPVGAHSSGLIGEIQQKPNNLVPVIMHSVIKNKPFTVFGNNYPTQDGTCVRDYVHVTDVAHAHVLALNYIKEMGEATNYEVFNIGTEKGNSVLELITSFEKMSGIKLNYIIGNRRDGDVDKVFANIDKAFKLLKWKPTFSLDETMKTAWIWLNKMKDENILQ